MTPVYFVWSTHRLGLVVSYLNARAAPTRSMESDSRVRMTNHFARSGLRRGWPNQSLELTRVGSPPLVEITGWTIGMQKVSCTELLRDSLGLGLADAKQLTDAILIGTNQRLVVKSKAAAAELVGKLNAIGVTASVA